MAIVVKYGAEWCGPCKRSKPDYDLVKIVYKDKDVKFYDVDIDEPEKNLPSFIVDEIENIGSIPFLLIKNANNGEIVRIKGWDEADLRKELEIALFRGKATDYSIIKPGTTINSDNEDDIEISSEEDEEVSITKIDKKRKEPEKEEN
jgi:thiol-disulfide isomerase/thioredoxin